MTFKVQKNTEKTENLKRFIKCVFELLLPSNTHVSTEERYCDR